MREFIDDHILKLILSLQICLAIILFFLVLKLALMIFTDFNQITLFLA